MEDQKRVLIAIFLSLFVFLFYWQSVLAPYERRVREQEQLKTTGAGTSPSSSAASHSSSPGSTRSPAANQVKIPSLSEVTNAGTFTVETEKAVIDFSILGGRITKLLLKEHRLEKDSDALLDLVHGHEGMPYPLGIVVGSLSDASVRYSVEDESGTKIENGSRLAAPNDRDLTLRFLGKHESGAALQKTIRIPANSYLFGVDVKAQGLDEPIWLEWTRFVPLDDPEKHINKKDVSILTDGKSRHVVEVHSLAEGPTSLGASPWISLSDMYFVASVVPLNGTLAETRVERAGEYFFARTRGEKSENEFKIYAGPKDYDILQSIGFSLDRTIDLGLFSFLAHPILLLLRFFFGLLGNWGLAIVLLTLTLKLGFLPLTRASYTSMQKMQEIQPEVKALRERIDDPTQLNQELMNLYKKRGVNPMGGCFPIMIQIPVFLGLYNALLNAIELRHAPFALWINDLSTPEKLTVLGLPLPVMILIMGASMFVQQLTTPSAMDPQQKKIFMMMPVIFTIMFIVFPMPSGLVLYWLVNNLISIVQQMYLRSDKGVTPLQATILSSVAIFGFTFVLTLI